MKRKIKYVIISITVLVIGYLLMPFYLQQALIHLFPGIDDYPIFSNRIVKTGTNIRPWTEAQDFNKHSLFQAERDTLEKYQTIAYLIIQNDSIVYEEYWDNYSDTSRTNSFSAAKSIVSLMIGAAIDDGYINSVDQKVGDFIPEFKTPPNDVLRIKDLLTMSSGSNWDESYSNPISTTTQAYYGNNITELVTQLKIVDTPGKFFSYKSGDSQLLSLVLKNATGMTLSDYASKKLWQPLGAVQNALWSLDKENGDEKAYCCFNSNARDFAKLGELVIKDGKINNQQLISAEYIKQATSPASYLINETDNLPIDFYGYQWWILNDGTEQIPYARGIFGQYIFVLRNENAIVVRLGHKRSMAKIKHHPSETYQYLKTAKRILKERQ